MVYHVFHEYHHCSVVACLHVMWMSDLLDDMFLEGGIFAVTCAPIYPHLYSVLVQICLKSKHCDKIHVFL